jgi:hypothetical protein
MTKMGPFECSGIWWVPDKPSDRVAGTLRFSHEEGLVLDLLGALGDTGGFAGFGGSKAYPIVLGTAYDCPHGQSVTLTGCRQVRITAGAAGYTTEAYYVERGFFGHHLTSPNDFLFSNCYLATNGLSAWAAHLSGFHFEHGGGGDNGGWSFRITYTPPPILKADIPGGYLELYINAGAHQTLREQSINEKVRFNISTKESISEGTWNDRYVYPLQNFLTLATDTPNALTEWMLNSQRIPFKGVNVVDRRIFRGTAKEVSITARQLIPLKGYEERFAALLARWLMISEVHRDACNIYFALCYDPGAYVDVRLLSITQSLQVYQAKRLNRAPLAPVSPPLSILATLPSDVQGELRRWTDGLAVDTFRETLEQLVREHQAILSVLSPSGIGALVDQLMMFRNHVLYRTPVPETFDAYSQGLYLVTETLSCLMKVSFLAELGFSVDERLTLFQRNAMFSFIRDEWAKRWELLKKPSGDSPV